MSKMNNLGCNRIPLKCHECGKEFFVVPSATHRKHCSKACLNITQHKERSGKNSPIWQEKIKKICPICNTAFEVTKCHIKAKYCSAKCMGIDKSRNNVGKNNPNYRGGLTTDNLFIEKKCKKCGKVFISNRYNKKTCCSISCGSKMPNKRWATPLATRRKIVRCKICNKEMSLTLGSKKVICSLACLKSRLQAGSFSPSWKGGRADRKCKQCGKDFTAGRSDVQKGWGNFCSRKCSYRWQTENLTGSNNKKWIPRVKRVCKTCAKEFEVATDKIKKGIGNFCSVKCSSTYQCAHSKKKRTKPEIAVELFLLNNNIDYKAQYAIAVAHTVLDFFLEPNICLYVDGTYWHNRPGIQDRDKRQTEKLIANGYKVVRIWEHELRSPTWQQDLLAKIKSTQ